MTTLAVPDADRAGAPVPGTPRAERLVGEGTPPWFAAAMALIGAAVACAVVWLVMTDGRSAGGARSRPATSGAPAAVSPAAPSVAAAGAPAMSRSGAPPPPAAAVGGASPGAGATPLARACPPTLIVAFGFDSAVPDHDHIGGEGAPLLRWLAAHPGARLTVQGHADAAGPELHNLVLSYQRARAVAAQLAATGVGAARLSVTAAGSHEPIDGLPSAAPENRRAVVRVRGYEECERAS
jgi:outer membrane protein OmpA-like peptidoglycan-associated protein